MGKFIKNASPADSTCVTLDIPAPHGHSIPLLEGKHAAALRLLSTSSGRAILFGGASSTYVDNLS